MTLVSDLVSRLDANLRADYEERAGIVQFDANVPQEHAEALALLDVLRRHPAALLGVTTLQIELDGELRYVLTTDVDAARQQLRQEDRRRRRRPRLPRHEAWKAPIASIRPGRMRTPC